TGRSDPNAAPAVTCSAAGQPARSPSSPSHQSPSPMPTGNEFTKMVIASTRPRPANQSVIILVISTFKSTPPMPAMKRPASSAPEPGTNPPNSSPSTTRPGPALTTRLSPKRSPSQPPGPASTTPRSPY